MPDASTNRQNPPVNNVDVRNISRLYRAIWRDIRTATIWYVFWGFSTLFLTFWQFLSALPLVDFSATYVVKSMGLYCAASIMSLIAWTRVGNYEWTFISSIACVASVFAVMLQLFWVMPALTWPLLQELSDFVSHQPLRLDTLVAMMYLFPLGLSLLAIGDGFVRLCLLYGSNRYHYKVKEIDLAFAQVASQRRQTYRLYDKSKITLLLPATFIVALLWYAATQLSTAIGLFIFRDVEDVPDDVASSMEAILNFVAEHPGKVVLHSAQWLLFYLLAGLLTALCIRAAWRRIRRGADAIVADLNYRPIVFLRSFRDEDALVKAKNFLFVITSRKTRLEEVVVRAVKQLGPAVAIGKPNEKVPRLGALRTYFSDDNWQDAIADWLRRSDLIVILAGSSPWSLWEFRYVLDKGLQDRVLLVLPPESSIDNRAKRWNSLCEIARGTPWETAMSMMEVPNLLCVVFAANGRIEAVQSCNPYQVDYELAIRYTTVKLFGQLSRRA